MHGSYSRFSICASLSVLSMLLISSLLTLRAEMTLTQAGLDQGLSLTTFATNFPTISTLGPNGKGPLGIAFTSNGGVLVSDTHNNVRLFPTHMDNQDARWAPIGQTFSGGQTSDLTQIGSAIYMTQNQPGRILALNNDGSLNHVVATNLPGILGIRPNPLNNHLLAAIFGEREIVDVDPSNGHTTVFASNIPEPDGIALSRDGTVLYIAAVETRSIIGINIATKHVVFDSGYIQYGSVDGIAQGSGALSNYLFVNLNSGNLIEVDLTTKHQTLIGTGGTRGDFAVLDPLDGTLLLTQSDRILRLHGVPEQSPFILVGIAMILPCVFRRIAFARLGAPVASQRHPVQTD